LGDGDGKKKQKDRDAAREDWHYESPIMGLGSAGIGSLSYRNYREFEILRLMNVCSQASC
jgi:hypothetical protein